MTQLELTLLKYTEVDSAALQWETRIKQRSGKYGCQYLVNTISFLFICLFKSLFANVLLIYLQHFHMFQNIYLQILPTHSKNHRLSCIVRTIWLLMIQTIITPILIFITYLFYWGFFHICHHEIISTAVALLLNSICITVSNVVHIYCNKVFF